MRHPAELPSDAAATVSASWTPRSSQRRSFVANANSLKMSKTGKWDAPDRIAVFKWWKRVARWMGQRNQDILISGKCRKFLVPRPLFSMTRAVHTVPGSSQVDSSLLMLSEGERRNDTIASPAYPGLLDQLATLLSG